MATPNRLIRFFLSILYLIVSTLIIVNLAQRVIGRMAYVVVCCIIFAILDVLRGMDHFIIRTSKRYGLWDYSSSFAFFSSHFITPSSLLLSKDGGKFACNTICLHASRSYFFLAPMQGGKKNVRTGTGDYFSQKPIRRLNRFFFSSH